MRPKRKARMRRNAERSTGHCGEAFFETHAFGTWCSLESLKWKTGQKENISNISQLPVPGGCHHDTASGHIRIMTPFCWNNIMLIHPPGEFLPASILGELEVRISLAVVALLSMFLLFDWQWMLIGAWWGSIGLDATHWPKITFCSC